MPPPSILPPPSQDLRFISCVHANYEFEVNVKMSPSDFLLGRFFQHVVIIRFHSCGGALSEITFCALHVCMSCALFSLLLLLLDMSINFFSLPFRSYTLLLNAYAPVTGNLILPENKLRLPLPLSRSLAILTCLFDCDT